MARVPSALLGRKTSKVPNSFLVMGSEPAFQPLKSPMSEAECAPGAHSRYQMPSSVSVKP